ncbi:protein of unknown function [Flaviramulus basaltis]|uniref:Bacteroides conjugative transposon TraN protein n=1 Tax=Flaviramulus basaltis TaxID=369401 RepID=A0A1K2IRA7_9FLAO|nr:DUF4138 domain-containing protein [Flaviramulus basaltis]SFZ94838.1 protein of unknown function [Flaviramulus basaltis]
MNTKLLLPLFLIFGYCSFGQGIRDTIEVSRKFKTILIFQENIAESIIGSDIGFSIDLPKEIGSKFNSRILKIYYDDLAVEKENFTNLTVITESGNLYDFILKLSYSPNNLTWNISSDMAEVNINKEKKKKNLGSSLEIHTEDIDQNVEVPNDSIPQFTSQTLYADNPYEYYRRKSFYMQFDKAKIPRYFARKDNVFLWLKGVYYNNNELYVQLKLENKEGIDLDINFIKYFIESSYKNTTKQKIPITKKSGLLYEYKVPRTVKGNTENHFVLVFKQFTLDNKKSLLIELDEESGNRNLSLRIGKDILNKPIRF